MVQMPKHNKLSEVCIIEFIVQIHAQSWQIFHENINKSLDGAYLADFAIDITFRQIQNKGYTREP